jgi:NAD(P)-dependent dehydrogenase (short-subunit alcohol dehydrogenase family)
VNRHVLVTGAGSGIGLSTTVHLVALGFQVSALVPTSAEADAVRRSVAQMGHDVTIVEADLSEPEARDDVVAKLELWALVNNAGYLNAGLVRDVPLADARRQLEAMVLGPIDLAQQALPYMVARGQGRIVNVTSAALRSATPFSGWYEANKAALRALNDALRLELRGTGVDVIDIEPGGYQTAIWDRTRHELGERQRYSRRPKAYARPLEAMDRTEPMMGDPAEVALAIGEVLTVGRPPAHRRVGADAAAARAGADLLPHRLTDWAIARLAPGR